MNKSITTLIVLSMLIASCTAQTKNGSFEPVAVIELFTSEGCSSCPPADKLLAKYDHDITGLKVFPLAFHVDYWNYLGWRDSFSSAQNTDRQKMYVDALGLSGAYTPQAIVNGTTQFVGSDESALEEALTDASQRKYTVSFSELNTTRENDKLKVQYTLQGNLKNCDIHFALVSLQVSTAVKRGENVGRKLIHTNVVRRFITTKASASGDITFDNTSSFPPDNTAVVAYVQHSDDHTIIAAAKTK